MGDCPRSDWMKVTFTAVMCLLAIAAGSTIAIWLWMLFTEACELMRSAGL